MFANTSMYIDPEVTKVKCNPKSTKLTTKAEMLNGRLAMLGIVSAFLSYAITGKLFFGIW